MVMHWVLDNNMFKEAGYQSMIDALERLDIPYSIHKIIPFIGDLTPPVEFSTKNVMCMGSYSLRHYSKKNGFYPGVFDLEPQDFTKQMEHWGQYMLNADSKVNTFENTHFTDDVMFIRPIHDSKVFSGGVMSKDQFQKWQQDVANLDSDYGDGLNKDTLIQVSSLKQIYAEYRFWIVDQKIVTYSMYKRGGRVIYSSNVDGHIIDFVTLILRTKNNVTDIKLSTENTGWRPHDAFVLDVCETDQGMKVVEINTLNSSGFYAGNMLNLVMALQDTFSVSEE